MKIEREILNGFVEEKINYTIKMFGSLYYQTEYAKNNSIGYDYNSGVYCDLIEKCLKPIQDIKKQVQIALNNFNLKYSKEKEEYLKYKLFFIDIKKELNENKYTNKQINNLFKYLERINNQIENINNYDDFVIELKEKEESSYLEYKND